MCNYTLTRKRGKNQCIECTPLFNTRHSVRQNPSPPPPYDHTIERVMQNIRFCSVHRTENGNKQLAFSPKIFSFPTQSVPKKCFSKLHFSAKNNIIHLGILFMLVWWSSACAYIYTACGYYTFQVNALVSIHMHFSSHDA